VISQHKHKTQESKEDIGNTGKLARFLLVFEEAVNCILSL